MESIHASVHLTLIENVGIRIRKLKPKTYLKSHWSLGKVTLSVAARDIEGTRMPPFEGGPKMVAASFSAPDVGRFLAKQLFLDKPGSPLR